VIRCIAEERKGAEAVLWNHTLFHEFIIGIHSGYHVLYESSIDRTNRPFCITLLFEVQQITLLHLPSRMGLWWVPSGLTIGTERSWRRHVRGRLSRRSPPMHLSSLKSSKTTVPTWVSNTQKMILMEWKTSDWVVMDMPIRREVKW